MDRAAQEHTSVADRALVGAIQGLNSLLGITHVVQLDDGANVLLSSELEHLVALLFVTDVGNVEVGGIASERLFETQCANENGCSRVHETSHSRTHLEHVGDWVIGHGLRGSSERLKNPEHWRRNYIQR